MCLGPFGKTFPARLCNQADLLTVEMSLNGARSQSISISETFSRMLGCSKQTTAAETWIPRNATNSLVIFTLAQEFHHTTSNQWICILKLIFLRWLIQKYCQEVMDDLFTLFHWKHLLRFNSWWFLFKFADPDTFGGSEPQSHHSCLSFKTQKKNKDLWLVCSFHPDYPTTTFLAVTAEPVLKSHFVEGLPKMLTFSETFAWRAKTSNLLCAFNNSHQEWKKISPVRFQEMFVRKRNQKPHHSAKNL